MKREIRIGLIGAGTVGSSVIKLLASNKGPARLKIGADMKIACVCDKNKSRFAEIKSACRGAVFTDDYRKVTDDPGIDVIVELTGIDDLARNIILRSLKRNKHVVTANKAALAEYWDEIFSAAYLKRKLVYFEAAVASGVPVIQALNEGLIANRINGIAGILNGTCNYILTRMTAENIDFSAVLKDAQEKGLAETNPSLDIEGHDTRYKLAILSSLAWGCQIDLGKVYCEGISGLDIEDVVFARREFGHIIKLLGISRKSGDRIDLQVRPCLVSTRHSFSSIENEFNSILIEGDACGPIILSGKGAGGKPAASAVVSDIMFLSREIAAGIAGKLPYVANDPGRNTVYGGIGSSCGSFYLRFTTIDRPGVLSRISGILGRHGVSIASVSQKDPVSRHRRGVPILMLTHSTNEGALRKAIAEIDRSPVVRGKTVLLKIFKGTAV